MGWGGRLFEAERLIFSAFGMGAHSRWALIRGWALIRINTVDQEIEKRRRQPTTGKVVCVIYRRLKAKCNYGQQTFEKKKTSKAKFNEKW